jgi:signal transduction histidine kinase
LLWWGPDYISFYNDAYTPILGRKHPWALGQPVREVWSEIWHVLKPLIDTPFYGGPATWIEDIELELKRDGFNEETHFTVAYSPVPDDTVPGGIGGVLATVHEITEKVIGERRGVILRELGSHAGEARTTEKTCHAAAAILAKYPKDIAYALIYLCNPDGSNPTLAASAGNAPAVLWPLQPGLDSGEMQLIVGLNAVVVPIRSTIAHHLSGFLVAGLSPHLKLNDAYRNFLTLATSQIAAAIARARAYEAERQRAEALAEIDRAKTAFFSNVSHEFRTPLTLMLGPLESVLARNGGLAEEDRVQLETAYRNSRRLLKLVNSLLDFSRIEAGRVKAAYAPLDLAALTVDLASNFRSAMEAAGLELIVDCAPLSEPVFVDLEMWEKIVLNLLSNAFKFTFDGSICIRLESRDGRALLTVTDTGVGIPPAELPHIFERFHRVEATRGRTYEGTGIGLALIQELVKLHGGTVAVTSTVGSGSTFTVAIPLGRAHLPQDRIVSSKVSDSSESRVNAFVGEAKSWIAQDPAAAIQNISVQPTAVRPRVLLADDNADIREYISNSLGMSYDVVAVGDGYAALEQAKAVRPDLVVSDVMMPKLDGFGLLRELRSDAGLREIPIILLSARAGEEARTEGIAAGADDYLTKPFSSRELVARVQTALELQRVRVNARESVEALNAELRNVNQDLEQFAHSASHDLQEPIRSVKIYSELLDRRYREKLDGQAIEFLNFIRSGAARMESLVQDLLTYTRATRLDKPADATNAMDALHSALANLAGAIAESEAQVTYTPMPSVHVHNAHLQQLFQNVIGNAIKYRRLDVSPAIHIAAERQQGNWRFSISDNGIGIEPQFKERIFGLFKRLHTREEYSGSGIGLAICQRIVERYHGRIWVESEPGRGSTFLFTLPV